MPFPHAMPALSLTPLQISLLPAQSHIHTQEYKKLNDLRFFNIEEPPEKSEGSFL